MPNYEAYLTLAKITLCVLAAIGCVLVLLMFFLVVLKSVIREIRKPAFDLLTVEDIREVLRLKGDVENVRHSR